MPRSRWKPAEPKPSGSPANGSNVKRRATAESERLLIPFMLPNQQSVQFGTADGQSARVLFWPMPMIDRTEFEQLILQIEQDLLLQAQHLGALLVAEDPTRADHHRRQLRIVSARIKRPRRSDAARA
jgi:hypothetical protein